MTLGDAEGAAPNRYESGVAEIIRLQTHLRAIMSRVALLISLLARCTGNSQANARRSREASLNTSSISRLFEKRLTDINKPASILHVTGTDRLEIHGRDIGRSC
jgi:hypothetical protein